MERDAPSDPDNSNIEERQQPKQKNKGKAPRSQLKRRYTLEPGEVAEEILLTEAKDGEEGFSESIFAKVRTAEEFISSATTHSVIWCNAIRSLITSIIAYQDQNHDSQRKALENRERVVSLTQQLKEKNQLLQTARSNEDRLRESRIVYRTRNVRFKESLLELQTENEDLKAQLRTRNNPNEDPNSDPDDSDLEERPARRPNPSRRYTTPLSGLSGTRS